jgi:hypothetical protein
MRFRHMMGGWRGQFGSFGNGGEVGLGGLVGSVSLKAGRRVWGQIA